MTAPIETTLSETFGPLDGSCDCGCGEPLAGITGVTAVYTDGTALLFVDDSHLERVTKEALPC